MLTPRSRLTWYSLTIFLSSAFLLVLEITAGRLLAPYIGVSLYTWTSIIGVILAGLSLGNWLGGRWADAGGEEAAAGITLALSGVSAFLILVLLKLTASVLQVSEIGLLTAGFIYVSALFFLPAMLLGVITPLLTTLALSLDDRTGRIVGRMHALAALGSIIGTFATGYWLVQYVGTRNIILGTAAAQLVLAMPFLLYLRGRAAGTLGLTVIAAIGMPWISGAVTSPCDRESNYYCIRVVDKSAAVPYGEARAMVLDHLMHGINHDNEAWLLIAPYTHLMDELINRHFDHTTRSGLRFFFAGGGAYSQPRATHALYRDARVTVAELDPVVTEIAGKEMYYQRHSDVIHHEDARLVLHRSPSASFDVVVGDVFHDIAIPYHLLTREFAQLVKSRLAGDGIYTINIVDVYPHGDLVRSVLKTLRMEFRYVDIWADMIPSKPARMTYVISATDKSAMPDRITASRGFRRTWYRITDAATANKESFDALPLLTDDYVPVERLISPLLLTTLGQ